MIALPLAISSDALVSIVVDIGLLSLVAGIFLSIFRLLRGPNLVDRAVALDVVSIQLIGIVILLTMGRINNLVLFDGVLVLSLLGFAGTVAVSQYVMRPHLRSSREVDVVAKPDD